MTYSCSKFFQHSHVGCLLIQGLALAAEYEAIIQMILEIIGKSQCDELTL